MNIEKNVPLAPFTTFGIGGPADFFVKVSSSETLTQAINFAKEHSINYFILGTGANILIGDKGFRGLVIKNEAKKILLTTNQTSLRETNSDEATAERGEAIPVLSIKPFRIASPFDTLRVRNDVSFLTVESGATIADLINFTKEKGLSGFEHFAGIPSSVGGALWQNLHFLSPDRTRTVFISEIVTSAKIFTEQGEEKDVETPYFQFGYDYSILHDRKDIVLTATFTLTPKSQEEIEKTIEANIAWRNAKHPEESVKTSAGSVFKKIEDYGAGRLIEKVGLKGHKIGGAMISLKHANFIINTGNAKASDVRSLIHLVQQKVKEQIGLDLQTEISFVGEF